MHFLHRLPIKWEADDMEDQHNTTAAEGGGEPEIKSLKNDKGQLKWPNEMSIMTSKSKVDAVQTVFL